MPSRIPANPRGSELASELPWVDAMLRIAGVSALLITTACIIEGSGTSGGDDDGMSPGGDMNGRVCTMMMTVSGSFTQSMPAPNNPDGTPYVGCWPMGTWTFTAMRGTTDCTTQPNLLPSYSFKVEQKFTMDGDAYQAYTYLTDPTAHSRIKVSQGGNGLCEGELNVFSADGTEVWIIKPELFDTGNLKGDGEYAKYKSDQWLGGL